MVSIMKATITIILMVMVAIMSGCSDDVQAPSGISNLPEQPATPYGLTASIADGQIQISWSVNDLSGVDYFNIYFSDSSSNVVDYLDSTSATTFVADNLINGRSYYFRISVVDLAGREGLKSRAMSANPGLFSISISNGAEYINNRNAPLQLTAPSGTGFVQLSEDSLFGGAFWESYNPSKNYDFSDLDGMKYIYARFQLTVGGESIGFVSDSIILDRRAVIQSVSYSPVTDSLGVDIIFVPGDTIHFEINSSETGGTASVEIGTLERIDLFDIDPDGGSGVGDGVYEVDYIVQVGTELNNAEVIGHFTDAAKNGAAEIKATDLLNINSPHQAVALTGYSVSSSELLLEWTQADMSDFSSYRLFRSETSLVDLTSFLVTTITSQSSVAFTDTELADTQTYFYRLYVFDDNGNSVGSDSLELSTKANDPLEPVVLAGYPISSRELLLEWTRADMTNFSSYRLFRSETPTVDLNSYLVTTATNQSSLNYNDTELIDDTIYYYRLFVFDDDGNSVGSNELSLRTEVNDPPAKPTLAASLTGDSLSVKLSWTESDEDDFRTYNVLRDSDTTGGFDGQVIGIINHQATASYLDKVPLAGEYFYQVWVADIQGDSTGSNMVAIDVP